MALSFVEPPLFVMTAENYKPAQGDVMRSSLSRLLDEMLAALSICTYVVRGSPKSLI